MFMQIIQAKVRDAAAVKATMDRWLTDLQPGATGWLGGTYGITKDNMLVACVRFTDEKAAQANGSRAEQGAWWKEMESSLDGPVTFHDCKDVTVLLGGGSDDATFVQVIQGRVTDRERYHELVQKDGELLQTYRPDVLGATIAIDDEGYVTETVSFVSEAAARAAEKTPPPPEVAKMLDEEMALLKDVRYIDLDQPWFHTARAKS
jgi:hypothetical protein